MSAKKVAPVKKKVKVVGRPKPSAPRAGITETRYGCGGKLKK